MVSDCAAVPWFQRSISAVQPVPALVPAVAVGPALIARNGVVVAALMLSPDAASPHAPWVTGVTDADERAVTAVVIAVATATSSGVALSTPLNSCATPNMKA